MTEPSKKVLVVGISGATCSGKTTIAKELNNILPNSQIFCQDDYYFPVDDPRHVFIPELNHINFDIISSLDMERMTFEVKNHIARESLKTSIKKPLKLETSNMIGSSDEDKFQTITRINHNQCHIVILEGFCIFNHKPMVEMCDLKYYFTLTYEECYKRRIKRVYEPPDCPGYFEQCAWPEHLKQLEEVRQNVKDVVYFNGNSINHSKQILQEIVKLL